MEQPVVVRIVYALLYVKAQYKALQCFVAVKIEKVIALSTAYKLRLTCSTTVVSALHTSLVGLKPLYSFPLVRLVLALTYAGSCKSTEIFAKLVNICQKFCISCSKSKLREELRQKDRMVHLHGSSATLDIDLRFTLSENVNTPSEG